MEEMREQKRFLRVVRQLWISNKKTSAENREDKKYIGRFDLKIWGINQRPATKER
jgi:hypothetical protein